jgi:hypothetical protein
MWEDGPQLESVVAREVLPKMWRVTQMKDLLPGNVVRVRRRHVGHPQGGRMSRILVAVMLLLTAGAAVARLIEIDLDRPGALEALEKERPAHHKRVMQEISKAQAMPVDEKPSVQKADVGLRDPRLKGAGPVLPSDPAKKRLVITVDEVVYRVTAHMTENPGKLEKAR